MTDLEKAQAEANDWKTRAEDAARERDLAKASLAFKDLGAQDVRSVELHWLALTPEEREKTTHEDFIKGLKKTNPLLFNEPKPTNTGSNPHDDGGKPAGPAKMPTHPRTRQDREVLKTGWKAVGSRRR